MDIVNYIRLFTLLKLPTASRTIKILCSIFLAEKKCMLELSQATLAKVSSRVNRVHNHSNVTSAISKQPVNSSEGQYIELSSLALVLFWKDH